MNHVEISGRLTRDPDVQYVGAKKFPIMALNVVVDNAFGRYNPETKKTEVDSGFYQVEVKGDYALGLKDSLQKGTSIYVKGSLTQWTMKPKEGQEHGETKTRIAADVVMLLTGPANRGEMGQSTARQQDAWTDPAASGWADDSWPSKPGGF